jgi:Pyridoxamine 5'-phosphate oxidase like
MALLAVRFECRRADRFTFGAVRCCRAVCSHVAIGAIEVGEISGEFVTHGKFVGRKIPAGVWVAAALHFQCERGRPRESNTYLSITGRAEILHDVAKIRELWSSEAQAWWPKGPTDPDVRVLRVVPDSAEYWDTRGNSITVALKLAAARLSGNAPDLGENKKVRLL